MLALNCFALHCLRKRMLIMCLLPADTCAQVTCT